MKHNIKHSIKQGNIPLRPEPVFIHFPEPVNINCFRALPEKWYHLGICSNLSRNNLSNTTQRRDWRIFANFAQVLTEVAHELYQHDDNPVNLKAPVFALDSSTIDLCLSLFS